jgi:signal transduction histidine kinase/CheY-like chemotaxis protein
MGTVVIALGARMAFGFCAAYLFALLRKFMSRWGTLLVGTFLATMSHSLFVYTAMWAIFPQFGLTPLNTLISMTKINGIITYIFALTGMSILYYFVYHTRTGEKIRSIFDATDRILLTKKHVYGVVITCCLVFAVAVSMEIHFTTRLQQILSAYHININQQVMGMLTSVGLQLIIGILALFAILCFGFIQFYRMLVHEGQKAQLARSSFFSNISHDMRTPLNGIIGFTDLALEARDPQQVQDYLQKIKISGSLLLDLVNDTLLMSKIENGMLAITPEPTDMTALMESTIVPIQANADSRGVDFRVNIDKGPQGYVLVDRVNIQKIFLNLLSNAVKFTNSGGTVTFTMELVEPPLAEGNCRITVADTGIGISEAFLPHIYDAFAQEGGGRLSSQPGTGLGLAIVKRLVDLMGGRISVTSAKGVGTTFTIYLPFPPTAPSATDTVVAVDRQVLACKKVLLCEDNELNAEIARTFLEHERMQVICAADGQEGVDRFAASVPGEIDLILMDIHMPVLDGYEATKVIRRLPRPDAATVPILAMTADAYAEDVRHCLAVGMNGHVAKPLDRMDLFKKIAAHCH